MHDADLRYPHPRHPRHIVKDASKVILPKSILASPPEQIHVHDQGRLWTGTVKPLLLTRLSHQPEREAARTEVYARQLVLQSNLLGS